MIQIRRLILWTIQSALHGENSDGEKANNGQARNDDKVLEVKERPHDASFLARGHDVMKNFVDTCRPAVIILFTERLWPEINGILSECMISSGFNKIYNAQNTPFFKKTQGLF